MMQVLRSGDRSQSGVLRRLWRYAAVDVAGAILIDYAGVLTPPLTTVYARFAAGEHVTVAALVEALESLAGPIADFECGELDERAMEELLAERLAASARRPICRAGLLARFAGCFARDESAWSVLQRSHRAGRRKGPRVNEQGLPQGKTKTRARIGRGIAVLTTVAITVGALGMNPAGAAATAGPGLPTGSAKGVSTNMLIADHWYTVLRVESEWVWNGAAWVSQSYVVMRNPWGSDGGATTWGNANDGEVRVSWADFTASMEAVCVN